MTKVYEIWREGFHVMEGHSHAVLCGTAKGSSFKDACYAFSKKNSEFKTYFDAQKMTWWGCRLFDNETDARKSFG
jgi:hypothetical protein